MEYNEDTRFKYYLAENISRRRRGNMEISQAVKFFVILSVLVLFVGGVSAIPQTLNLHGRLTDSSGSPISGSQNIVFKIYDLQTGGTTLYDSGTLPVSVDSNGVYNVDLVNVNLDFSGDYYLGIKVGADSEMSPRINLTSSPYSFRAQNISVSGVDFDSNVNIGSYNLTTSGTLNVGGLVIQSGVAFINFSGDINTTGAVIANRFIGDGSQLTGIGTYNSTYAIWAYNQTTPFADWLLTFVYNYNQTYTGGTYNSSYVPYTGATGNVDLGEKNLTTTGRGTFGNAVIYGDPSIDSLAIGAGASTTGYYSIAIGYLASATNYFSTAIGAGASTTGEYSTAIGYQASATNDNQIVFVDGNGAQLDIYNRVADFQANNINTTGNITGAYFIGDGSQLTGISGINSSWNETRANGLYLSKTGDTGTGNYTFVTYADQNSAFKILDKSYIGGVAHLPVIQFTNDILGYGGFLDGFSIIQDSGNPTLTFRGSELAFSADIAYDPSANTLSFGAMDLVTFGSNIKADENIKILTDDNKLILGAGEDASIYYNATDMIINPKEVGAGKLYVLGNITANYFIGDGSQLTGISGINSSWNETRANSLYSGIEWGYNQTYTGGTYNSTYAIWGYNQTTPAITYTDSINTSLSSRIDGISAGNLSFNQTLTDGLYLSNTGDTGTGNYTFNGSLFVNLDETGNRFFKIEEKSYLGGAVIFPEISMGSNIGALGIIKNGFFLRGDGAVNPVITFSKSDLTATSSISYNPTTGALAFGGASGGYTFDDYVFMNKNLNVTGNATASYYFGDGSQLSNLPASGNESFNQTLTDGLYAKYQFANNNFNGDGNFTTTDLIKGGKFESTAGIASGSGSIAIGYADRSLGGAGNILSSGTGSIAMGYLIGDPEAPGSLSSEGTGSIAMGWVSSDYMGAGNLTSKGVGSIAMGFSERGTLQATGIGSVAMGYVVDGGILQTTGDGSVAMGYVDDRGILQAVGAGSIAMGYAYEDETLQATGAGSVAMGQDVQATQDNAISFGKSFINNVASSLAIGFGQKDFVVTANKISISQNNSNLTFGDGEQGKIYYDGSKLVIEVS